MTILQIYHSPCPIRGGKTPPSVPVPAGGPPTLPWAFQLHRAPQALWLEMLWNQHVAWINWVGVDHG